MAKEEDMSEEAELFDYIINPEKFMQLLKKFRDLRYRGESKKLGPVLREMLQTNAFVFGKLLTQYRLVKKIYQSTILSKRNL